MVAIDGPLLRRSTCIGGRIGIAVGIDAGEFSLVRVNYALYAVSKLTFSHVLHGHKPLHLTFVSPCSTPTPRATTAHGQSEGCLRKPHIVAIGVTQ
jgi:hypothetical protein